MVGGGNGRQGTRYPVGLGEDLVATGRGRRDGGDRVVSCRWWAVRCDRASLWCTVLGGGSDDGYGGDDRRWGAGGPPYELGYVARYGSRQFGGVCYPVGVGRGTRERTRTYCRRTYGGWRVGALGALGRVILMILGFVAVVGG